MKPAKRHRCSIGGFLHTAGDGIPKRKKCAYCGARLITEEGTYGVFIWTGDGRYRVGDAHRTFATRRAADRYADAHPRDNFVSRWIGA